MKKIASLVLATFLFATVLSVMTVTVSAQETGIDGGIRWELNGEGNTLTISPAPNGDGKMKDYKNYNYTPWYDAGGRYRSEFVTTIIVKEGVTRIGTYAFCYFNKVTRIELPKSCTEIAYEAFYKCEGLEEVSLFGNVGEDAFVYCGKLRKLTVGEGCKSIGQEAFSECYALEKVTLPSSLQKIECEAFEYDTALKKITYYGTKEKLLSAVVDDDNEPVFEAINGQNGRTVVYKTRGIYDYIDADGNAATLDGREECCLFPDEELTELKGGWYVVDSKIDFGGIRLSTSGNTNILLLNGCGFTTSGGISVFGTLNIYSQTFDEDMGYIDVGGAETRFPGIGSDPFNKEESNVNIYGGRITSYGGKNGPGIGAGYQSACTVTIAGGNVTAVGGDSEAAGIGSGQSADFCTVTITGGTVTATGVENGAGIGSAKNSNGNVTIKGGNVTANGGRYGAGIGSGCMSDCNVTITGGTVTANGGAYSAGIGSGHNSGGTVTISGGKIDATGGSLPVDSGSGHADGIGNGYQSVCSVTDTRTGSALFWGYPWIVIAIGVLAIGAVTGIVIIKKKKKPADGNNSEL